MELQEKLLNYSMKAVGKISLLLCLLEVATFYQGMIAGAKIGAKNMHRSQVFKPVPYQFAQPRVSKSNEIMLKYKIV